MGGLVRTSTGKASYSAGEVTTAPLQNHSRNGSIDSNDSNEHPLGTLSSGGILGVYGGLLRCGHSMEIPFPQILVSLRKY